jgi:hypothetical protein
VSGDYSRHSFDPRRYFSSVLMQQGRVALDADWNELAAIIERRWRAETVDIIGRAVVPKETPDGFKIGTTVTFGGTGTLTIGGGGRRTLTIGRGRMYVHGLLAENFGLEPFSFDLSKLDAEGKPAGVLAELIGGDSILFEQQPFYYGQDGLPDNDNTHLVYLDVWQREVTAVEDERLLEPALGGVDTTTRLQTVWQVKVLPNVGDVTCATPDVKINNWPDTIAPSAGRLSSKAVEVVDPNDPCLLPPKSGYRGLENQLYRVEIHTAGAAGTATFKWSRDDASVATNIVAMPDAATLMVTSVGRDSILRFSAGDWVEITDDLRELAGLPGDMRKVKTVDDAERRITLTAGVSSELNNTADVLKALHARVRRWDQKGVVRDVNGVQLADLDAATSDGTIKVPADGAPVILENGCQITFSFEPAGGRMHSGDFWTFAARSATATVEELDKAPPRGVHHHYCRLAVVKSGTVSDCRVLWPPDFTDAGCGCTVCVTPESHNNGTLTIQQAVDSVKQKGGTVCLDAGIYYLGDKPVIVDGARSVRIVGQGVNSILWYVGANAAIVIRNSLAVSAEQFSVLLPPPWTAADSRFGGASAFLLQNAAAVEVRRCAVLQYAGRQRSGPAIRLSGVLLGTSIVENALLATQGVAGGAPLDQKGDYVLTLNLTVRDNLLACIDRGISLEGMSFNAGDTRLAGNTVYGCSQGGIIATGTVAAGRLSVAGNLLFASVDGDGILIGTAATSVEENNVQPLPGAKGGDGIALIEGVDRQGVQDCEIAGNRITGMTGRGIAVRSRIRSAAIRRNIVRGCRGGIVMDADSAADTLAMDDNQVSDVALATTTPDPPVAALRAVRVDHLRIGGNIVRAVGTAIATRSLASNVAGIDVIGCNSALVVNNDLDEIGAADSFTAASAIQIRQPFGTAQVVNNVVRRAPPDAQTTQSSWRALLVGKPASPFGMGFSNAAAVSSEAPGANARAPDEAAPAEPGPAESAAAAAPAPAPAVLTSPLPKFHFVDVAAGQFIITGSFIFPVTPAPHAHLGVQGNHLLAAGGVAGVVSIAWPDACVFANNQCFLDMHSGTATVVSLSAPIVVASSNVVRGRPDDHAMQISAQTYTVLGNITSQLIMVNGSTLSAGTTTPPDKWKELNERAP